VARIEVTVRLSERAAGNRVKYVSGMFRGMALSRWDELVRSMRKEAVMGMAGDEFKRLTTREFYPESERLRMENELRNHRMVDDDHVTYTNRFRELSRLVPHLVAPIFKQIERYIQGLNPPIQGL
jgi:Retrotransposon gag protein